MPPPLPERGKPEKFRPPILAENILQKPLQSGFGCDMIIKRDCTQGLAMSKIAVPDMR